MMALTFPALNDSGTGNMVILFVALMAYAAQDLAAFRTFASDMAMAEPADLKAAASFARLTPAHLLMINQSLEIRQC